jgi:uncharacterized membrane protein YGL010W
MKGLTEQLAQYADYHRDQRNIATHFIGIPAIMVALAALLARWDIIGPVTAADIGYGLALVFYWRLGNTVGMIMTAITAVVLLAGHSIASLPTTDWLSWGIGLFVGGWILQFVGHFYEKRKPAFVDDISGLLVGPLFVIAEVGFLLGLAPDLRREVEARVGPTLIRS